MWRSLNCKVTMKLTPSDPQTSKVKITGWGKKTHKTLSLQALFLTHKIVFFSHFTGQVWMLDHLHNPFSSAPYNTSISQDWMRRLLYTWRRHYTWFTVFRSHYRTTLRGRRNLLSPFIYWQWKKQGPSIFRHKRGNLNLSICLCTLIPATDTQKVPQCRCTPQMRIAQALKPHKQLWHYKLQIISSNFCFHWNMRFLLLLRLW